MRIINLLPKSKQQELYYRNLFRSVSMFGMLTVATFLLVLLVQAGVNLYLARQGAKIDAQIEQLKNAANKEENNALKERIKLINSQIADFNNITQGSPKWSNVLRAFAVLVPEKVSIQSFSVDLATKQVVITGFSPSREQVIALYNNIAADREHFTGIDYPLENVSRPTNVSFHFSFTVQDALLK